MDLKVTNAETGKGINGAFCSIFVTDDSGGTITKTVERAILLYSRGFLWRCS